MDTISFELGILFLLLFMMPVLYIIFKSTIAQKRIKKEIQSLGKKQNLTIKNIEVIGNTIIGMDENHHNLVFSNIKKTKETFQIVPVGAIKTCAVKTGRIRNKSLDTVGLELMGPELKKEILFYQEEDESIAMDGEVCLHEVRKWEKTINQNLQLV